ncbi:Death-associated protein kinase 1, partial [Bienertia sinuspersici]
MCYGLVGGENSTINMVNTLNGKGAALTYTKSLFQDDSISIIKLLLEKNYAACCLHNADGMTPLLKATKSSYLRAIEAIINHCPESLGICDFRGRNILHHMSNLPASINGTQLIRNLGITVSLMDHQDNDGNTPMHMAIMSHNFSMVKAMFESNANFTIKNNEGVSAAASINPESNLLNIMRNGNIKQEGTDGIIMNTEFHEAVAKGNWEYLIKKLEEFSNEKLFLTRLPDGSNIFHIVVESCPLNFELDSTVTFLDGHSSCLKEQFILDALKKFPILTCQTNRCGQTPLHLAMFHRFLNPDGELFGFLQEHLKQMKVVISYIPLPPWKAKDRDGNTLLHLALKYGRFKLVEYMISLDEELVGQVNNSKETPLHMLCQNVGKGRNVLHWIKIDKDNDKDRLKELYEVVPNIEGFMRSGDDEKNTPLHVALENGEYGTAMFFMERLDELRCKKLRHDMKTILDILAASQDVPRWVTAFTVPGGYNDSNGTPFLMNTVAFRIFMLFDVVAMCSSMMVLLCLLWFLAAYHNDDREELALVDLTIGLLQVSFYATLVAFMA